MSDSALTYDNLLERLGVWAGAQADIRAAIVLGSRARQDHPADVWSDLDLLVIVADPERYLSTSDWFQGFGTVWLSFIEKQAVGDGREWRVLYDGGLDVDLSFVPLERVKHMIAEGFPPEVARIFRRGYRFVLDKEGLSQQIERANLSAPVPTAPTADEFLAVCNDFLYHAVWVAKKLRRGELWTAQTCLDSYMKRLLLRLLEWHTQASHNFDHDTWHAGRFIEQWADKRAVAELRQAFSHYDAADLQRTLFANMSLFRWLAQETAQRLHYTYPLEADKQVTGWITTGLNVSETAQT